MCVLWKMFNKCMWMLKGIYAQNWLCLYMCVCCIAVGSLRWNRRSLHDGQCGRTSGFTVKNNNEPRTLPKQGFRDVWECERECMWKFLHIVCQSTLYSITNNCSPHYHPSASSLKCSGWLPTEMGTMAHCDGLWCPVLALTCFLPHAHNSARKSHLDWTWSLSWCCSSSWFCSVSLSAN